MAETLRRWLATRDGAGTAPVLRRQLLAFSSDPAIQAVIAEVLGRPETPAATRSCCWRSSPRPELDAWPPSWVVVRAEGARRPR